ncbi:S-layer homology domain-containing protein [Paenibacillus validus]|nr:S-layer homology domain-containing protein [Paenibacillus validus]
MMNKTRNIRTRGLACLLSFALLFMLFPMRSLHAESRYSDVGASYGWATSSITLMSNKQILTGYPDGRFRPEKAVSKAEWTTMVYRLFDKYRPNATATGLKKVGFFADVTSLHWASKPISDVYDASFQIGGYGVNRDGQLAFMPDMPMSRLQLAQMLYAFFGGKLMNDRMSDNDVCAVVLDFKDIPATLYTDPEAYAFAKNDGRYDANGWMYAEENSVYKTLFMGKGSSDCTLGDDPLSNVQAKALAGLKSNGIMTPNDDGYFRPKEAVSRAEAVVILDRIYHYLKNNQWLSLYSTVDLSVTGPDNSGGAAAPGSPPANTPGGSFNYNPNPGAAFPSTDRPPGSQEWTDRSNVRVTDYFDDKGVIVKNIAVNGEIETAVQPGGTKYLTVDLKSKEAVDLYVIVDGRIGFVRKEELPLTLTVGSAQLVGIRSQLRDTSLKKYGDYTATLSVQLSDKEPESKKKK